MLNASLIVDTFVTLLQAIPGLVKAMTIDNSDGSQTIQITGFHYMLGSDHRLQEAIYKMPAPSILVVWKGTEGGNWGASVMWKHRLEIYLQMGNAANLEAPVGYEQLCWLIANGIPAGATQNLRAMDIIPGKLQLVETPSFLPMVDADQMDMFHAPCVFDELGDN